MRPLTRFRTRHRRKDGSLYDISVRLEYMADETSAVFVAFSEDMTEWIKNEASLQQSEALLTSVIETAPDAIITINVEANIVSFSRAAEDMFGYRGDEVIGRNVDMLMPEPYRSAHDGYIARYLITGEKRIIGIGRQVQAMRRDGSVFPMELAVGEARHDGQHLFTGFIRDVSERVAMEKRTSALQRELNHATRLTSMGEMASALAHELNQPLSAIANYTSVIGQLLTRADSDPKKAIEYNGKVGEQAQRAGEIIRRLREFMRRGETERVAQDVNEVVREAVQLATIGAAARGVQVVCHLAADLPAVTLDRIQIQQVVVNLVRNAIDAVLGEPGREVEVDVDVDVETRYDTVTASIDIAAAITPTGEIHVTVCDSGPGIPDSILSTMFDPFVTSKSDGMGIGLAVSRSIVEAHGGRIWAENGEGGTKVHFTLPVERATR